MRSVDQLAAMQDAMREARERRRYERARERDRLRLQRRRERKRAMLPEIPQPPRVLPKLLPERWLVDILRYPAIRTPIYHMMLADSLKWVPQLWCYPRVGD